VKRRLVKRSHVLRRWWAACGAGRWGRWRRAADDGDVHAWCVVRGGDERDRQTRDKRDIVVVRMITALSNENCPVGVVTATQCY
jgi:hypothetical protein